MRGPELRTCVRWFGPVLLVGAWLFLLLTGDRWWPSLPLLYGPRFVLAPLVLFPLASLIFRRDPRLSFARRIILPIFVGAVGFLLLVDFRLPWRSVLSHSGEGATPLRLLTWNAAGGGRNPVAAANWINAVGADVSVITECQPKLAGLLEQFPNRVFRQSADLCFLTTLPLLEWTPRSPKDFWKIGGAGAIARMVVDVGGQPLVVGGVHLETPREALQELMFLAFASFRSEAMKSIEERDVESAAARDWIRPIGENRPSIVMGDFNLPAESAIFRRWWGDFSDAFGDVGLGLGWTKRTSSFGVRIDHILTIGGVEARSVRVGPELGSDHQPVRAEIMVRSPH